MAPDFALHGWDGGWHVERSLWLENLFQSYDIAEYHHSDIVPHIYGDVAAITSKYYWRGTRAALEDIAAAQRDASLAAEQAARRAEANAQWQQQLNQAESQRLESHAIYKEQTGW